MVYNISMREINKGDNMKNQNAERKEFINYVMRFYGPEGIYAEDFDGGVSKQEVALALALVENFYNQEGDAIEYDSITREQVRAVLDKSRGNEADDMWKGPEVQSV